MALGTEVFCNIHCMHVVLMSQDEIYLGGGCISVGEEWKVKEELQTLLDTMAISSIQGEMMNPEGFV